MPHALTRCSLDVSISEYYAKSPGEIARAYARSGYQQLPTVVDEAARRRLLDVNKREVWRSGFLGSALQLIEYITLSTSLAATTAQSHPDIPFSLPQLRVLHVAVEGLASAGVDSSGLIPRILL